jgi:hypothetical protein
MSQAALQALSIPFKDDAALTRVFTEVSGGSERVNREQYVE